MGWDDFAEIEKSLRTTRAVQDNRSGFHKKNRSGFLLASRKEQQRVIIFAREVFMTFFTSWKFSCAMGRNSTVIPKGGARHASQKHRTRLNLGYIFGKRTIPTLIRGLSFLRGQK